MFGHVDFNIGEGGLHAKKTVAQRVTSILKICRVNQNDEEVLVNRSIDTVDRLTFEVGVENLNRDTARLSILFHHRVEIGSNRCSVAFGFTMAQKAYIGTLDHKDFVSQSICHNLALLTRSSMDKFSCLLQL